ncbi:MAG: rhodanese-related sulfurtransferase [Acidimicrobiia bacterium]|nr:MAG: rhodanese-related sulfurtransferase [Acidimicrobiia bacterium]
MFHIAAFYHFVHIDDVNGLRTRLQKVCLQNDVKGTILLSSEGINGTIAGEGDGVNAVLSSIIEQPGLANLVAKRATAESDPFYRLKVRAKREIVALGVGDVDSVAHTGTHVPASGWNALISDPDTIVIDTRNDYEVAIGTFKGAVNPMTRSFGEFPAWVEDHPELRDKRLAMFCTGGIRCEKATAYLRESGFDEVYQLEGGILTYLETENEATSLWSGECYVFDRRVSVGHGLVPGDLEVCPGCNQVIGDTDRQLEGYRRGVCCHGCEDELTPERESRFAERQHQIELAEKRGKTHLGQPFAEKTTGS